MTTSEAIPVRKVELPFGDDIPRHWIDDSAVATHFFNGLNLVFPDGERFFIRAVQDHVDRITDDDLRARIKGFAGQEGWHAKQHERYFEILEAQGYRIRGFLRHFRRFIRWSNRLVPAPLRLSITAGAEHYTATLGANALDNPLLEQAHPVMRQLIHWHALEELEHKSVAFDVLRQTHPSHALRIIGFLIASLALLGWTWVGTRMLLRQDGVDPRAARAELRRLRRVTKAQMERALAAGVRAYRRRDFHPDEKDDAALVRRGLDSIRDLVPA
jgi:predicted metal-dependent hydrolase